jgi:lipoyl(octanoyl) transferase
VSVPDGSAQGSPRLRAEPGTPLRILELGTAEYRATWELQKDLVARRQVDEVGDTVVLVEHPAVYTLGRRATTANVLLDDGARAAAGIDVVAVDRGGDVTYHGPGQLVVYPIIRLAGQRHVVDFVRALEQVALEALRTLGVTATLRDGLTGVWVGREKIVAIGVRVGSGGVTSHGLALNVAPDLTHFSGIVPCGLATEGVTSLAALGSTASMDDAAEAVRSALADVMDTELETAQVPAGLLIARHALPRPDTLPAPTTGW